MAEFGPSSWELDAVEPRQLAALVRNEVSRVRDETLWAAAVKRENAMKAELQDFVTDWRTRNNGHKS